MDIYVVSMSVCLWKILMPPEWMAGITAKFSQGSPFKNLCKKYYIYKNFAYREKIQDLRLSTARVT